MARAYGPIESSEATDFGIWPFYRAGHKSCFIFAISAATQ